MAKRIRISNETLNCFGTWVKTDGVDLEQFRRNPVMLWMHWRGIIIGNIRDLKVEGAEITGEPYLMKSVTSRNWQSSNGTKVL